MSTARTNPRPTLLTRAIASVVSAIALVAAVPPALGQVNQLPPPARGLEIVEHLGDTLPMGLEFVNSDGAAVKLGSYFSPGSTAVGSPNGATGNGKPTVVALVYFSCPTACTVVLNKMTECFGQLDYGIGTDFNVLTFSFKQEETTFDAAGAKARYLDAFGKHPSADLKRGWQFHTGTPEAVRSLADTLGFGYRRLENGEYSHPVALFVVTPEGRISRYVYGFDYKPAMVKMALLEASKGQIAKSVGERFMAFCYQWDPAVGGYTLRAYRVMQVGGVLSAIGVGALIVGLRINEGLRRRRAGAARSNVQRAGSDDLAAPMSRAAARGVPGAVS